MHQLTAFGGLLKLQVKRKNRVGSLLPQSRYKSPLEEFNCFRAKFMITRTDQQLYIKIINPIVNGE